MSLSGQSLSIAQDSLIPVASVTADGQQVTLALGRIDTTYSDLGRSGLGGDDVPESSPHRGFDLERWKAGQIDFEGTIRNAYAELTEGPAAKEIERIVEPFRKEKAVDWNAVTNNAEVVQKFLALQKQQQEEEEMITVLLLYT